MIYYALGPKQGMKYLEDTWGLRVSPLEDYIPERQLRRYVPDLSDDEFFAAVGASATLYAFVLDDMKLFFHPDGFLVLLKEAYQGYFSSLV